MTLLDLARVAPEAAPDGHLVECEHRGGRWADCRWCTWALRTPTLERLLDLHHDAGALEVSDAADTVGWVVATDELLRVVEQVDLDQIRVPSARGIAASLQRRVTAAAERLRDLLRSAVAPGGPVEQRCVHTAGPLAAAALQHPHHRALRDALPAALRSDLERISELLSSDVQAARFLPAMEAHHWRPLPRLRTQPEWSRRPTRRRAPLGAPSRGTPHPGTPHPGAPAPRGAIAPGTLEDLVVESVYASAVERLAELGGALDGAAAPVAFARPAAQRRHSSQTRATMWRIARIDWHATFVDTGRAECWNARLDERDAEAFVVTDVPWQVALAIGIGQEHGLVSATHVAPPAVLYDPR